jgi:hypothetical protein
MLKARLFTSDGEIFAHQEQVITMLDRFDDRLENDVTGLRLMPGITPKALAPKPRHKNKTSSSKR